MVNKVRNILVFPDGTKEQFMYPSNRTIEVGEQFQVTLGSNTHILKVESIDKKDIEVFYYLSY